MRLLILFWFSVHLLTPTPTPSVAWISPTDGAVLQGSVPIRATLPPGKVVHLALEFAYAQDATHTWFPLWEADSPPDSDLLTTLDTFAITDGNYRLRLTITLENGTVLTSTVDDLRVRNYTPIETPTPTTAPALPTGTPRPATPPPPSPPPRTPTPLPPNPAEVTSQRLSASLRTGVGGALLAFLLWGVYVTLRKAWYQ